MTLRQFLHTRLGFLIWTLLVALLAYNAGQSNPVPGLVDSRPRLTA
ncbi:hypothetical protein [Ralstonia solanacearum]|nr:hypothetical protein [Ralstonia solanacearum]QNT25342.1 hypothetical protein C2I38_25105 [Ralstonia solanacearum]QNT62989.1 hypothetical protein C2L97_25150 [Ralstonia solanacearum]